MNTEEDRRFPSGHPAQSVGLAGPEGCHSERSDESIAGCANGYVFRIFSALRMTEAWKVRLTPFHSPASRIQFPRNFSWDLSVAIPAILGSIRFHDH